MLASHRPPPDPLARNKPPPLSSTVSYSSQMAPTQPHLRTSTLKRKRPVAATSYRSETQIDSATGRIREVIVIDDSPTPPPQSQLSITPSTHSASAAISTAYSNGVRTRAQVAAEASGSRTVAVPPAAKRRKKDTAPVSGGSMTAKPIPSSTGGALQRKALAARAYDHKAPTGYTNGSSSNLREVSICRSAA